MKLNILFVDDEPSTLLGLKRSLRSQRQEWNMLFAESAKVAQKILRQEKVNVNASSNSTSSIFPVVHQAQ